METEIERVEDYRIKKMLVAVTEMYRDYQFFVAPVFEGFDSMSKAYEQDFKQRMVSLHEKWIVSDGEASLEKMTAEALREWRGR